MSIEGLNALIQLESVKLEGHKAQKATSDNVNSSIQQKGLQTSQKKQSMSLERIQAEYEKECQTAEVKYLESKLVREQAAEQMALVVVGIVGVGNLATNGIQFLRDAFGGAQELGDLSKSLQAPHIDPQSATIINMNAPNSASQLSYCIGNQFDESNSVEKEVVYSCTKNGDGSLREPGVRTSVITSDDKARVLGEEYKDKSFAEIQAEDPEKAAKLVLETSRGISKKEAENYFDIATSRPELSDFSAGIVQSLDSAGLVKYDNGFDKFLQWGSNFGKSGVNCIVQTAEAVIPYFDAWMKMKDQVEETTLALQKAMEKLDAASKRLKSIEESLEEFSKIGS